MSRLGSMPWMRALLPVPAEQGDLASHPLMQFLDAKTCLCRGAQRLVTGLFIEGREALYHGQLLVIIQIHLVEQQTDRYSEAFGRDQKTVDEPQRGARLLQGDHQEADVDVGSDDVADFGKIGALALDIVAARLDAHNRGRAVGLALHGHVIAHHHRIGALDAVDAELPAQATRQHLAPVGEDVVPAAGGFHH